MFYCVGDWINDHPLFGLTNAVTLVPCVILQHKCSQTSIGKWPTVILTIFLGIFDLEFNNFFTEQQNCRFSFAKTFKKEKININLTVSIVYKTH